jgi:hypothetical protein
MSLLRRTKKADGDEPVPSVPTEVPIDRVRFDRLIETSLRLRDLGVDFDTIQRRAEAEDLSLNDALEAIDRERSYG